MDHALTRELESWADRLGWRWFHGLDTTKPESLLVDANDRELGCVGPHLGDPWGWVLEVGDGEVREGSSPTGRVAKGALLAEALLGAFVCEQDGWQVRAGNVDGGEIVVYEEIAKGVWEPRVRAQPCGVVAPGRWIVMGGVGDSHGDHDTKAGALADMVCRTMTMLDEAGLVPGGEGEPEVDDGEIDREQLARTRRALEGFE